MWTKIQNLDEILDKIADFEWTKNGILDSIFVQSLSNNINLSSTSQNPAYSGVFNSKFKSSFDHKPNQIPTLGIRIQPQLQAIGFR